MASIWKVGGAYMFETNYGEYTEEAVAVALRTIQDICSINKDSCGCSSKCPFLELWDGGARQICHISYNYPDDWKLNQFPPKQWEPFYKG